MMYDVAVAVSVFVGLWLCLEAGFRIGRRAVRHREAPSAGLIGSVQGATLGLLGLLLGFSFAGAGSRFLERQDLIVSEANAIGTATLRADLLEEPHRSALRGALAEYTRTRIEVGAAVIRRETVGSETFERIDRQHGEIWKAATEGVRRSPEAGLLVLGPVNEVIDLHALRIASSRKHLPPLVMGLLMASSILAMASIGYGCGMTGRRVSALTWPLLFLIGTALWTTIDLDHPRAGLIRLSDAPLQALKFDGP